jgi:hypothetical protein
MKPLLDAHYLRLLLDQATGGIERTARRMAAKIDWSDWKPGRQTVLCLARAQFRKDIIELRERTRFNWVTISATKPKKCQEPWVAPQYRDQTYFTQYLDKNMDGRCRHLRAGLEMFGHHFLKAAALVHPIDAVMAGNTDYWQDDAIKLGCRRLGIPFLVLARENYTKPSDARRLMERFLDSKFRFSGTAVAVFAKETRDVMVSSGSFTDSAVSVTGAPRFDRWLEIGKAPQNERIYMTFLSYADPIYLAERNFAECLNVFAEAAKANTNPDLRFIIKVKKPSEVEPIEAALPQIAEYPVQITWDMPLYELLPRSRIVIGYNSLAAAEGFLTDAPVVIPTWGDALREEDESLIYFGNPADAAVADFPRSIEELRELIARGATGQLKPKGTPAERRARFSRHIALPETGTCSTEVQKFVERYVAKA